MTPLTRTELRQGVREIWQIVLTIEIPEYQADFLVLGGHETHFPQVRDLIKIRFDLDAPLAVLAQYSNLDHLVDLLFHAPRPDQLAQAARKRTLEQHRQRGLWRRRKHRAAEG